MAASKTEIANMALSHLGVGTDITDLDNEPSAEALACRRFYDNTLDEVLRIAPWPFASAFADLGLITSFEDDDHPTDEWDYAYQVPSDCLFIRRIVSGSRVDTNSSLVEFKLVNAASGTVIYTDQDSACVEYTRRLTEVNRYPSDFVTALSFRLAAYIAPRVTGGDPFKMSERALQFYSLATSIAEATAFNEERNNFEPLSDLARARD